MSNLRTLVRILIRLVALSVPLFFAPLPRVYAATINVDDDCSLANAIRSANGDTQTGAMNSCESGADTITLWRDVALHKALPAITSELTIEGNHHTLRRAAEAGDLRLLSVAWSGDLTINNLTLRNGRLSEDFGGAIALENGAALTVYNSMFQNNYAGRGGGAIAGVGLQATIHNSLFINNTASHEGGDGGAVLSEGGAVSVANSSFLSNTASSGGAITVQYGSTLEVYRSEFIENSARYGGGAIVLDGNLNVSASSFIENRAEVRAGAIYVHGSAVLENSTFYGNELDADDFGSAVEMFAAIATLQHVTIVNSRAPILAGNYSELYMVNSVVAGGMGGYNCEVEDGSGIGRSVNNWLEYGSCDADHWGELELSSPQGSPGVVPLHANSYLIDRAPVDAHCLDTDQRGMPRPNGYGCDIGAIEGAFPHSDGQPAADQSAGNATNRVACDASLSGSIAVESDAPGAQCQELSIEGFENPDVMAAVDVGGYIGAGVTVCFTGDGRFGILDDPSIDLTNRGYASTTSDGRTCALVDRAVSIAFVSPNSEAARASVRDLANCAVTTSSSLNLRSGPHAKIIDLAPADATLIALARNDDWFQVEYQGELGWISGDYVTTDGDCD